MKNTFTKFEPMSQVANQKIDYLIDRGGAIILERRSFVLIKRIDSVAKIDQFGRVEWTDQITKGKI